MRVSSIRSSRDKGAFAHAYDARNLHTNAETLNTSNYNGAVVVDRKKQQLKESLRLLKKEVGSYAFFTSGRMKLEHVIDLCDIRREMIKYDMQPYRKVPLNIVNFKRVQESERLDYDAWCTYIKDAISSAYQDNHNNKNS
jgi:hypothetical protein